MNESEQRVADALRARATGAGGRSGGIRPSAERTTNMSGLSTRTALLIALLGGAVLGMALALFSLLVPGLLPPLG